jgi:translation elongation factor EF-Tu-like GTPase
MSHEPHIEAEVRFLTTEEGGRRTPVKSGYRGQFFYDGLDWDANHDYPDVEWVQPGDIVRSLICFMSPEKHVGKVVLGKEFSIREGTRVIAKGRVVRLLLPTT